MEQDPPCNILLVDDQPENLLALEALLSDMGHRLVRADSGREALKHLLAEDFALILLDVRMPDMDGFETAAMLRERERSRFTPIIFLTAAYKSDGQMFQGYSVGAVDYIFKPFAPEILKSKVSVFIDLHRLTAREKRLAEELEARVRERTAQLHKEVVEKRRAEEQLINSLREKEMLLKEIHHRVKNNLQIVHSLINLQSRRIRHTKTLAGLKDCGNRVKAMALVHERLYGSKDLGRIDLDGYIRELSKNLFVSWGVFSDRVETVLNLQPAFLTADEAVHCGLIVYELLSNCLKHAFPKDRSGRIEVTLRWEKGGRLSLNVQDDGVGLPPDFNPSTAETLGMQLLTSLVSQLDGSLEFEKDPGTEFRVSFSPQKESRALEAAAFA